MKAAEVAARLAQQPTTVLGYLFPAGKMIGQEFCVGSLQGEPGKSLKVACSPQKLGVWQDFATGESGGDLLDLWAAVRCGADLKRAVREAHQWLGAPPTDTPARNGTPPTRTPRLPAAKPIPGGQWVYRDTDGADWITIRRVDYPDGKKAFFQHDNKTGKPIRSGGHQLPEPRPLYNLDLLQTPGQDVWFVEGEKAAEALRSVGLLATTTIGGASSPQKTDFTPLAGRRVFLWPDNDTAGMGYCNKVVALLQAVDAVYTILPIPADKPASWDAADAIAEGWGRAEVEALIVSERVTVQEQEQQEYAEYPCPDALWRGVFAEVADIAQQRSWEVWMGTLAGLAALAHRQITVRYFGTLCGNVYGLLIKPTGTGKKLCTDICENLLPEWYMQTGTVSSGPGLMPILADIERAKDGTILSVNSHPVMMVLHEWTSLAKYLKIQFSSLSEDLNKIFDCPQFHSIGRSDREKTGGHVKIPQPTLSILGTTTEKLFRQYISEEMVFSGFLNRYLILPGSYTRWELYNKEQAAVDFVGLLDRLDLPRSPHDRFGARLPVDECYTQEAWNWFYAWGLEFFEHGLMNGGGAEIPMSERLHVYAHKIALLYAWSEQADFVEIEHVEAARSAIEVSTAYLKEMAEQASVEAPPNKKYEIDLANRVLTLVKKKPGELTIRKLYNNHLRKSAAYNEIKRTIAGLVEGGDLAEKEGCFYACESS